MAHFPESPRKLVTRLFFIFSFSHFLISKFSHFVISKFSHFLISKFAHFPLPVACGLRPHISFPNLLIC